MLPSPIPTHGDETSMLSGSGFECNVSVLPYRRHECEKEKNQSVVQLGNGEERKEGRELNWQVVPSSLPTLLASKERREEATTKKNRFLSSGRSHLTNEPATVGKFKGGY